MLGDERPQAWGGLIMHNQLILAIEQNVRSHVIDNTDPRELTEQRLRFVYQDYSDQKINDLLDLFYEVREGYLREVVDEDGSRTYRAVFT